MTYLLDSNACVGYLNGRAIQVEHRLRQAAHSEVAVCSVVKAELFAGALKSQNPLATLAHQRRFLNRFTSLPFDDVAADCCARTRAHLERRGQPIGPNDLMIASIALAHDLILVTSNVREFARVPGLHWEDWEHGSPLTPNCDA